MFESSKIPSQCGGVFYRSVFWVSFDKLIRITIGSGLQDLWGSEVMFESRCRLVSG